MLQNFSIQSTPRVDCSNHHSNKIRTKVFFHLSYFPMVWEYRRDIRDRVPRYLQGQDMGWVESFEIWVTEFSTIMWGDRLGPYIHVSKGQKFIPVVSLPKN